MLFIEMDCDRGLQARNDLLRSDTKHTEGKMEFEIVTQTVRIAFSRTGIPPFTLEFLLNDRWTPGVEYDTIDDARRAGLKLSEGPMGKSILSMLL